MASGSNISHAHERHRVVSFFSGCGGLDLGFKGGFSYKGRRVKRLPFEIIKAYDFSPHAVAAYRRNIGPHAETLNLGEADVSTMPKADVLLGGFPCQEFSRCGPRRGLESERGKLYKAMVRYAKYHHPHIIVCENVADILYINGGWDYRVIKNDFAKVGYRALEWEMNAAHYGVPQNRKRVFILLIRNDSQVFPVAPRPNYKESQRSAKWAIDDLVEIVDDSVPNQSQFFKAAPAGAGHGQGDEITPENKPAYTIRANAKSRIQFHYSLPRRLTIRECARLQTFPDNFIFPFGATENILQIGNAVPPLLAYRVASSVSSYLHTLGRKMHSVGS